MSGRRRLPAVDREAFPCVLGVRRWEATMTAAAASGGELSSTQSLTSAAWDIPATARPKNAGPASPYHQSGPVKVPVWPPRKLATGPDLRWVRDAVLRQTGFLDSIR
ncbi:hypothetical protein ACP70R_046799 [Stipagrostis hirtigluma subsp. patula]